MQGSKWWCLLVAIGCLGSCGRPELQPSDYVEWVNNPENGLRQTRSIDPLQVMALYKPLPYLVAQELRTNEMTAQAYDARATELEGMQYYTLQVAIKGRDADVTNYNVLDNQAQQERLAYLSFGMQQDIQLIQGSDTLPCKLFHFERSYDLAPHRTFVLAFDRPEGSDATAERTLVVELAPFNTGPLKFHYSNETLSSLPILKR